MLCYNRIEVPEEIDVNKTSKSKECDICHYWCFLHKDFKFQPNVCNGCHDLLVMSGKLSNIAVLNIKGSDYCYIISGISKNEATNLKQNTDLTKKGRTLWKIKNLFPYVKMDKEILTFGNIEIEKNTFYRYKSPIPLRDVDINKVLVFNKISFDEKNYKYFIGYLYNDNRGKPLHIMLL